MITIYLAEDQVMIAQALQTLLDLEAELKVLGVANDGQQALKDILELKPDIALLDIEMPHLNGLDVATQLRESVWSGKVIVLTTFARKEYFAKAVENEVAGYLLKDSPSVDLIQTIKTVFNGQTVYESRLVKGMFTKEECPLTKRELQILSALQTSSNTQQIAQKVYLAEGTIRNYISAILSKTGTSSRLEAVLLAKENGWI